MAVCSSDAHAGSRKKNFLFIVRRVIAVEVFSNIYTGEVDVEVFLIAREKIKLKYV